MQKLLAVALYALVIASAKPISLSPPSISAEEALEDARDKYAAALDRLGSDIVALDECARADGIDHRMDCRDAYTSLRNSYKETEVLLDYLDHESVSMFFNGAPLLTLEPKVPEIVVLEPEGLQVIDELLYLGEGPVDGDEFKALTSQLISRYKVLKATQRPNGLQHYHVWNGIRLSLIRMYTLGVTGFDTPGSVMALPDAYVTMNTIGEYYSYYNDVVAELDGDLAGEIVELLEGATGMLQLSDDFNAFDRMEYLKEYVNPLFAKLLRAQRTLGVELPHETNIKLPAIDLRVTNLFDPNLFNKDYYTGIEWDKVPSERIELGRLLFFDPVLSRDLDLSCASCHHPEKAFTDGQTKSHSSVDGRSVMRNSPTLINCVYSERFFLDMREEHLERQIKHVVLDSLEFNTDFLEIVSRLEGSEEYKTKFAKAYPDSKYQLSKWSISDALACYVASLTSFDSEVDKYIRDESNDLSEAAYRGYNLFMGKGACGTCHFAPTFNGSVPPVYRHTESEVLGVPSSPDTIGAIIDPDLGRIASSRPTDESWIYQHAFKTTTVRNVALTAPYMHNGVYKTLEEVVDFYNRGGGAGIGIDVPNQTLPDAPLDLTDEEISDIVSFMEALTDTTGLSQVPSQLPSFESHEEWNDRRVGGQEYE